MQIRRPPERRRTALRPNPLLVALALSGLAAGTASAAEKLVATVPGSDFDVGAGGTVQTVPFAVDQPITGIGFTALWTAVVADNNDGIAPWSLDLGVTVTAPDGSSLGQWGPLGGDVTIADYPLQDFTAGFDAVDGQGDFVWSFTSTGAPWVAGLRDVQYHLTTEVPDVVQTREGSVAEGPQWFRPYFIEGVSGLGPVVYDAVEFQVSVAGGYEIESVVPTGNHFLALYRGGFDPEQPLENLLDYGIGNGFSWDGSPQGTSRISALLLEDETYHLVASQWSLTAPGQDYVTTVVGPGEFVAPPTDDDDPPSYGELQLQARSNLLVNDEGWNLPPGASISSITADINDAGDVTFPVGVLPIGGDLTLSGTGIWSGGDGEGQVVFEHAPGSSISPQVSINAAGEIAYYTHEQGSNYRLWRFDPVTGVSQVVNPLPLTPSAYGNPAIADDGTIGYQARLGTGRGFVSTGDDASLLHAADSSVDPGSDYVWLYSPDMNNARLIAGKVSVGDYSHNEVRLFDADGGSVLLAADNATDPDSPFQSFDNSLSVNDAGQVAVIVRLTSGARAVYRLSEDGATRIAEVEQDGPIRDIEFFAPAINEQGLVAFRARDEDGQAIYVGDGGSLVRVVGRGDVVETDLGTARIGQHIDDPSSWPVFSGAPRLNNQGDVVFVAGLHPAEDDQVEWGTGIIVAQAGEGGGPGPDPDPEPEPIDAEPIANNQLVAGLSGAAGDALLFRLDVPEGASSLRVVTLGGSGDVALSIRHEDVPSAEDNDGRSDRRGNNETVQVRAPEAGAWYVLVEGVSDFARVSLRASYTAP